MITKRRKRKFNTTFFFKKWASYHLHRKFRYIRWIVSPLCASKVKRSQNFSFFNIKEEELTSSFQVPSRKKCSWSSGVLFYNTIFSWKNIHASCKFVMFQITQLQKLYKNTCMVIHKTRNLKHSLFRPIFFLF